LKECEIAAVGDRRGADDCEGGGLSGDDGEGERPPRGGAPAQEIILGVVLAATKTHSQRGDAEQVGNNNRQVERMNAHRVGFPRHRWEEAEKWVENSGRGSLRQGMAERLCEVFAASWWGSNSGAMVFKYALAMKYVLGFDGGGTKTECVLMDAAGRIVARSISGPSNPSRGGVESATVEINKAAELCLQEAGIARNAVEALGAGLAGTAKPEMKESMQASLAEAFPGAVVNLFTDLEMALAAAGEGPVIVLVAGTGSAAIGRDALGQVWRMGGYGPLHSDDGSAYDIGSRAVRRAMREREQRGTESRMGKSILEQLGCDSWPDLQKRAAQKADSVYPLVFPVVAMAADEGDTVACEILVQAAVALSSLVNAVAEQAGYGGEDILIAKTGGTVGRSRFFDAQVDAALKRVLPQARIGGLRMPVAEAAARAARR
jgi:glucosamine kinase